MAKLTLNSVGSLIDTTTAATTINNNNTAVVSAMENTLSRDGTSPNSMSSNLDMNSNRILNLPAPISSQEPLRYTDLSAFVGGGTVTNIPAGGAAQDVMAKNSATNYDVGWKGHTGTGNVVLATSPTMTTPILGAATATSVNKVAITAPTNSATLTIADGKTLAVSSNLTLAGPDGGLTFQGTDTYVGRATTDTLTGVKTFGAAGNVGKLAIAGTTSGSTVLDATAVASGTLTLPAATDTLVGRGTADTFTGVKTFGAAGNVGKLAVAGNTSGSTILNASATASGTLTLPAATDTLVGKATTDTFTNKTMDVGTAGGVNTLSINSTVITAKSGSGGVLATDTNTTLANPTFTGSVTATNLITNSALAQMPTLTIKGNNTGGTANASDLTVANVLALIKPTYAATAAQTVNFNSVADTTFNLIVPTGATSYRFHIVKIQEASAAMTSAVFRVFTASGGGGTALTASTTGLINTASALTSTGSQIVGGTPSDIWIASSQTQLFFRVTTAHGSAVTAKVSLGVEWMYA